MHKYYGLTSYGEGLKLQENIRKELLSLKKPFYLIGLEHKAVLSLGIRGDETQDLLIDKEQFLNEGFEIIKSDRGGQATLHMPGQVVIYPIVDLKYYHLGVRDYVCQLAKISESVFRSLGLEVTYDEKSPGLYAKDGKIAFIGIRVQKAITSHGLAFNLSNSLKPYQWVRSCGQKKAFITRLCDYNIHISPEDFFDLWLKEFVKEFS